MKIKITLFLAVILASVLPAMSQVTLSPTVRTPQSGFTPKVVQDYYLWVRKSLGIPYTNSVTPVVLTTDSVGSNFQMLSNGNLAVSKGLGTGFFTFNQGGGVSNLALGTATTTTQPITNSSGTGVTLPVAVASVSAGLLSAADKLTINNLATTYAPLTGGTGYIQNQLIGVQTGNFWISGTAIAVTGFRVGTTSNFGTISVVANNDGTIPVVLRAFSPTQTADLQRWQNSVGTTLAAVTPTGNFSGVSFIKTGGSSSQFLKADGSSDATAYAPLASPSFTGTPLVPTAAVGTNTTQAASTAFVLALLQDRIKYGSTVVTFDGSQTVFNLPHGMSTTPTSISITFGDAANDNFVKSVRTITSTNIVLTCDTPPLAGSQTVYWQAYK